MTSRSQPPRAWGFSGLQEMNSSVMISKTFSEKPPQRASRFSMPMLRFCRRGKGGQLVEKVSLSVAGFQHGEARPSEHTDGDVFADFALHTHAVVLNLAMRADGTVGRLDGRQLFAWKMAAGARYHQYLAEGLRRLGFAVEVTGKNGMFEVGGVDPDLRAYFSARRKEIVDELAEFGLTTGDAPALASAKALTTRMAKRDTGDMDRHAFWREKCVSLGFDPEREIAHARDYALRHELPILNARTQVTQALAALTERSSTFERRELVAAVASALVQVPGQTDLDADLARLETEHQIVPLAEDAWGHTIYSTPEIIALEQGLFYLADRLGAVAVTGPQTNQIAARLATTSLNAEQLDAARSACASVALSIIEGGPGVGKSTLLAPVAEVWREAGWRVIGASTAWKIANQLRDDLGIKARAIDSWSARSEHGGEFLTDKTLLIIDEAGLLTSKQLNKLLLEVERLRNTGAQVAVRLVGDRRQLQPIGGPGLRIVADAVGVQRVDTIVRQRHEWARATVAAFGCGQAQSALADIVAHDQLHYGNGPRDTVTAMVAAWSRCRQRAGIENVLMIAKSNRQVLALNSAARTQLRAEGVLPMASGQTFEATTPSSQSHTIELVKGDAVRFLKRNDRIGVVNGTTGTIEAITRVGNERFDITMLVGGRKLRFAHSDMVDEHGRLMLAHAYASSCYGSQGLTTEHAFVLADPGMDRHDIFVSASRAREATHLFVDRAGLNQRILAARPLKDRQSDIDDAERLDTLAAAFSTARLKVSTLDYLRPTQALQPEYHQQLRHRTQREQVL